MPVWTQGACAASGADMFPNQFPSFLPTLGPASLNFKVAPATGDVPHSASGVAPAVRITDIYQAAQQRAIEDLALDKLFNPEFYGDAI